MPVKHDLYQDLGLSKEVVHERRANNKHLNSLFNQYDAADKEVLAFEASGGADEELEKLKKKRLSVKDKIVEQLPPTTER
ncbi:YdcH family protein [Pseudomonas sp. L1(2025)]|uniref:YdcH family protein n=1 Tax=Pseudomonas sp. L1(2025) TaxID=3449429 RepID=UPI003F69342C